MEYSPLRLAGLFFVQSFSRGILLSVIPLQAFNVMGDAQRASLLLFTASVGGIFAALVMPWVIRLVGNYRAFLIGSAAMVISALLLSSEGVVWFGLGLFAHTFAIAATEVCLTLYILSSVPRTELTRFEPWRIVCHVFALTLGPFLGVYFKNEIVHWLPFAVSILFVVLALVYFWMLGLHRIVLPASRSRSVNIFHHVSRFIAQPRLRLAYGLILARSCWWTMFIIYTPIYAEQSGLGALYGAALVSIGTAWTLSVPFWGWFGRKYGIRWLLQLGFFSTSALGLLVYLYAGTPEIATMLLLVCALGTTILDGTGNVLFYRAVRAFERPEMTAVFLTYRDVGQVATPGLYAILLGYFALPVVFLSSTIWMMAAGLFSRYVPRRMH